MIQRSEAYIVDKIEKKKSKIIHMQLLMHT